MQDSKVWKFGFDSALISSKLWKFDYIEDMSCKGLGSYPLRCWAYTDGNRTINYPGVNRNGYVEVEDIKHSEHTDYKQLIVNWNCSLAWILYITGDTLTDQVVVGRTLVTASKFDVRHWFNDVWRLCNRGSCCTISLWWRSYCQWIGNTWKSLSENQHGYI